MTDKARLSRLLLTLRSSPFPFLLESLCIFLTEAVCVMMWYSLYVVKVSGQINLQLSLQHKFILAIVLRGAQS